MERKGQPFEEDEGTRPRGPRPGRTLLLPMLAIGLIAIGAVGGVVWSERRAANEAGRAKGTARGGSDSGSSSSPGGVSMPAMPGMPASAKGEPSSGAAKSEEPVEVSLTAEALERAGIKTVAARSQVGTAVMTVPATVMSNAYRDTKVNALVGGILRQVRVELGSTVERDEPLAVVFSAELADAQMKYLSMQAMLTADQQKRERTDKLVRLGAASRQELEEATAMQAVRATEVAAARQRLLLLGLSEGQVARLQEASQVISEVTVPAPASGIVIMRSVNPGQVVNAGQDLFVVADLSSVWVIGDLYEKDFETVRVGSQATVGIPAAPKTLLRGRVAYIDPRIDPATRTAKVRVEVPNRNGGLRLGMFVTLSFQTGSGKRMTLVPRAAVQSIGDRSVVYVPVEDGEGRFAERPVKLGQPVGDAVEVLEGLKPGEKVVTEGSFFLRAEAGRARSGG